MANVGNDFDLSFLDVTTTVKTNASANATTIDVTTSTGMAATDTVAITLDSGDVHWDIISSVTDGDTIVITTGIPSAAAAGNAVKSYQSFMCRQQGETKDFLVTDAPLLPQALITEAASADNIDPTREVRVTQSDWRKGIQDEMLSDSRKYYDSENCDARIEGVVTLSPKKLSSLSWATAPSAPTITDAGFEDWQDVGTPNAAWVEGGDSANREDTVKHGGDHSCKYNDGDASTLTQEIIAAGSIATYKSMIFTAAVWVRTSDKDNTELFIKLNDGDTNTESSGTIAANNTWEQKTVTHRVSADATKLEIVLRADVGAGDNGYFDDVSLTLYPANATGSCVKIMEFGDDIVAVVGKNLYTIGASSTTLEANFTADITDLCMFDNDLYIAQGWSAAYYETADLETITLNTLSNNTAKYMAAIGSTTFVISESNSTLRSSTNPADGGTAFSNQYQIGSDDHDITGLVDHEDTWFIRKEDDVYYVSGSDVLSLADLDAEYNTTYTYGIHRWGDNLYLGSGVNSLYEYDISASTITNISPTTYAKGDANYDEYITAICHDESYLYIAIDNGTAVRILAGRWENVEGTTDWYWHPIYSLTSHNEITCMFVSSLSGSKILYAGTDTASDGVLRFRVPIAYSEPYTESGYECQSSGTFYTPWYRGNFPTEDKYWKTVDITSICCTDKTSITPYYRIKGGSWTALTALTTSAYDSGYPAETTDSRTIGASSERVQFKFALAAADDDYTPILYGTGGGITAYGILQNTKKKQIIATLMVCTNLTDRTGDKVTRTVSTDLTSLRALYTGNAKLTIVAPDDSEYSVVFARDGYQEQLAYYPDLREEVWLCTLRLLEV